MPVTVVTGARQTGRTTLVHTLAPLESRAYLTLDDMDVLDQAQRAPDDLVARASHLTIDEVQRAPDLLLAIRRAVDRRRGRGRFVLTASANLLLMRTVSETLAGRAGYLTLWPMTRREQLGLGRAGIWTELLAAKKTTSGSISSPPSASHARTGAGSRFAAAIRRRRRTSTRQRTEPHGLPGTRIRTSSAIWVTCRQLPACRTFGAGCARSACGKTTGDVRAAAHAIAGERLRPEAAAHHGHG